MASSTSRSRALLAFLLAAVPAAWGCGSPSGPSTTQQLPLQSETASLRYFFVAGDTINVSREQSFHAWATERLGVTVPQKIDYRKYLSRAEMGKYTGNGGTNAYAEPEKFTIHTIFSYDNHEIVHVYTALIGRPSDFFNEGIAVSFQTDPANNDYSVTFNGIQVHDACRTYLRAGTLPQPLGRYVTTDGFRSISDSVLSYRMAGSFLLFLQERFGLPAVLAFFRSSGRNDSLAVIQDRFRQSFGTSLEQAESDWLAMLR